MRSKVLTVILISIAFTAGECYACIIDPVADLEIIRPYAINGKLVTLDASDSYDPDGIIVKYEWDFDDDQIYDYYETASYYPDGKFDGKTTHVYTTNGTKIITVKVTDYHEASDDVNDTCVVSNDNDNDGMPNAWENLYSSCGLDPNDNSDQDGDFSFDNDGYNNLCEYLHGKEPNNAASVPDGNYPIIMIVPEEVGTIQRALTGSMDGDTIVLSQGTHYENISFKRIVDGSDQAPDCTLRSSDPNDEEVVANTIIDANGANIAVLFEDSQDADSVLKGFTITGANYSGIKCDGASPLIANCVITGNGNSSYDGGGMYNYNSSPTVMNCFFADNTADDGGGMYNEGSSPTVTSCVFSGNEAVSSSSYGGGMYNYNSSSPKITNCTFSGNHGYYGGGIYNQGSSDDPNLVNCILWDNTADFSCSDIYYNYSPNDPILHYCDIEDARYYDEANKVYNTDPEFIDADDPDGADDIFGTLDDGLWVSTTSVCVDAADGNNAPAADITGRARIDIPYVDDDGSGTIKYADIGAYEMPVIWFVDINVAVSNNGSSWTDAFEDLQDALALATDGHEIWVADGTYKPADDSNQLKTFAIGEGVSLYGGFSSGEAVRSERDWRTYSTILSGDIDNDANLADSDNSIHVVRGEHNVILDGFTIIGGFADGSGYYGSCGGGILCHEGTLLSMSITNCTVKDNYASEGAGLYYRGLAGRVTLTNCVFSENTAVGILGGGGAYITISRCSISNCVFTGNIKGGLRITHDQSRPGYTSHLTNCVINDNSIWGLRNYESSVSITNCIIWDNGSYEILNAGSSDPNISYSCIEDCGGSGDWDTDLGIDGGGNIEWNPRFADANDPNGTDGIFGTSDDGLRLLPDSNCIDEGYDDAVSQAVDIKGDDRKNRTVDMGAYEFYFTSDDTIYVNIDVSGGNENGTTWANAFKYLQDALDATEDANGQNSEIWVAEGTYYPDEGTGRTNDDRTETFELVADVAVYGGFDPTTGERDWANNVTILSGDVGTVSVNTDNSYNVVVGAADATLDGFTITMGYADGSSPYDSGGGMYNEDVSPTVTNCIFTDNAAYTGGGMYNENCSPTVTNCIFDDNYALYGGGMSNNSSSSPTVTDCEFTDNEADIWGGGMENYSSSSPSVINCTFQNNSTTSEIYYTYGGGMYNKDSNTNVENCAFLENMANYGGGMLNNTCGPEVKSCAFIGNGAYYYDGDDVYGSGGGIYNLTADPNITNCTFVDNISVAGGAIFNHYNSSVAVKNCILWGNFAVHGSEVVLSDSNHPSTLTISYSDVDVKDGNSWAYADANCTLYWGTGNIICDP
ncbi:MAG: right-handed parallel beta-helix repeat-containing protein, partial [Desulfobacteraceae bacterium]|nr:right-handed parallel beta-helix repeat-containing protein [Desulfobacteraceae bacterium]